MLGFRTTDPTRSWITRLGVLPTTRRRGTGQALMDFMLAESEKAGIEITILEVIKGNAPAHALFIKCGFQETRQLLIVRRAPKPINYQPTSKVRWFDHDEALALLPTRKIVSSWVNEADSYANVGKLMGLHVTLPQGGSGWMVFERRRFTLSRLIYATESGRSRYVAREMLAHLHHEFFALDTYTENIPTYDPHLPAFIAFGYFESFRRIEMYRYPQGWLAQG